MQIGTINIPRAVLLAPMEDVTDIAFRLVCKNLGADIMYTEFVNADGLARDSKRTKQKMEFLEEERPFGIQLYGGDESSMDTAARMAESLRPDLIDINCGCWVRKIVGRGAGSGLLRNLPQMRLLISTVVEAVSLPVTVKTRLGWDEKTIQIIEVAKMVEDTGAKALTIHCRTRAQGHKGEPDYSLIPAVKQAVSIPVIVNGGIDSPERAKAVFDTTGCDGVMVARAAIENPWIFREIKHYLDTGELLPPRTARDRFDLLLSHLRLAVKYKGEQRAVIEFRKHYAGYLRELPWISKLRVELMKCTEEQQVIDHLNSFFETLTKREVLAGGEVTAVSS